jgi:hypothetical protein
VLLGPTQREGDWTSTPFTITAAGWNIGWAYQCAAAPASFQVFVAPVGTTSTSTLSPVVSETAMSGQAVTSQSSLGQQILFVNAPANCAWAIKVTGS